MRLILLIYLSTQICFGQTQDNWVWMNGYDSVCCYAKYGTKGVPSVTNTPQSLYEACQWTDLNGNFWLFGGTNFYIACSGQGEFSDLWRFNPLTNEWTWMKGPGVKNSFGVWGTKGVSSISNSPSARAWGVCTWTDKNGVFWMYGGFGYDSFGVKGVLSDLWRFDPVTLEWTWMKGPNTANAVAVYGTKGVAATSNNPEAIQENNCTWVDPSNNLWLFGGMNASLQSYNSLWKYNIATNNWTWMWGSPLAAVTATYGTLGIESVSNNPGGRSSYCSFYNTGRLYIYGGINSFNTERYNDIWSYNISTGNWRWDLGVNVYEDPGSMQLLCDTTQFNFPESRQENRSCWFDSCGFFTFGGFGSSGGNNELWYYNIHYKKFTWLKGPGSKNYGTKGVSVSSNLPDAKAGCVGWTDNQGNLWMFGGNGASGGVDDNSMWKFTPDPNCAGTCNNKIEELTSVDCFETIPNVFTPNADRINDVFSFETCDKITSTLIYNRWGNKVFETNTAKHYWDGRTTSGEQCVNGTYFYIIVTEEKNYKGFVQLMR